MGEAQLFGVGETLGALRELDVLVVGAGMAGVGLGILLDTFVVRTVIIPALFTLIGPRIWWPALRAEP